MQDHITVKGARANNLKNIDVSIPRDKLVVLTGVSLGMDTSIFFKLLARAPFTVI